MPDDVPVHQVKEFAPDLSFGGSASSPGLVALALSDDWDRFGPAITDWRRTAVYYAAITSEGRGRVRADPGLARPARHVPPDPPRPGAARQRARPPRARAARGRRPRRVRLVPRRAARARPPRPRRAAGHVRRHPGQRDDRAPVLDGADGRRRPTIGHRQLRPRPRLDQRVRQRRLAAARRTRRQPAGVGDGVRHPQRPTLPRTRIGAAGSPGERRVPDDDRRPTSPWSPAPTRLARVGAAAPRSRRRRDPHHRAGDRPRARHQRRRTLAVARVPGVEAVVGDMRTRRGLDPLFAGIAGGTADGRRDPRRRGHPSDARRPTSSRSTSRGTVNVAAAARAAGVRRLVHVSSNSPFGVNPHRHDVFRNDEPYHPYLGYGRSKMLAELRLLEEVERGLDAVIVRPPWFYGPHQPAAPDGVLPMVRTGRFPVARRRHASDARWSTSTTSSTGCSPPS